MVKKIEIIATFFSFTCQSQQFTTLSLMCHQLHAARTVSPFNLMTLISQTCKFVSITRTVIFVLHNVHSIVWSFCIFDKINEGIHCDPQLYLVQSLPLVICTCQWVDTTKIVLQQKVYDDIASIVNFS